MTNSEYIQKQLYSNFLRFNEILNANQNYKTIISAIKRSIISIHTITIQHYVQA